MDTQATHRLVQEERVRDGDPLAATGVVYREHPVRPAAHSSGYEGVTSRLNKLLNVAFCIALASPFSGSAMGLLPKSEGLAAWESLQGRVLAALGGSCAVVKQPAERVSAISVPAATRGELALNKVVAASLHPMGTVKFVDRKSVV